MRASDLVRTTAFRWAFTCTAIFALGLSLFATLIYRETVGYLTSRVDAQLQVNAYSISRGELSDQIDDVGEYLATDSGQFKVAGLFDARGRPLAGNLRSRPPGLSPNRVVELSLPRKFLSATAFTGADPALTRYVQRHPRLGPSVRVLLMPAGEGRILLVGADARVVHQVEEILSRALWLTLPPMLLLALAAGWIVTRGALRRIAQVHESGRRIMAGELHERLPTRGTRDDFDQLSQIVNSMLDEIERLLLETRGIGEGIAHDMRTPLTRLRSRLERVLEDPLLTNGSGGLITAGVADIDQTLGTLKALLRMAEVEHGARRAAFEMLDLEKIVTDVVELYEPIAEEEHIKVYTELDRAPACTGDTDLLFEALANLIDNAIKFSPSGSHVRVALCLASEGPYVRVADSGPGIAPEDWTRVTRRFFRSDRSRHTPGSGLGLSLVASIVRLHGFGLMLDPTHAGCCIDLQCWPHAAPAALLQTSTHSRMGANADADTGSERPARSVPVRLDAGAPTPGRAR
ncbi:MAG: HAMP domain-containing sensor histidine kinase [Steroidobacteraceae bacterium]